MFGAAIPHPWHAVQESGQRHAHFDPERPTGVPVPRAVRTWTRQAHVQAPPPSINLHNRHTTTAAASAATATAAATTPPHTTTPTTTTTTPATSTEHEPPPP